MASIIPSNQLKGSTLKIKLARIYPGKDLKIAEKHVLS